MRIPRANAQPIWAVLCKSATIDEKNNDLSLNGILDGLVLGFPGANALAAFNEGAKKQPVVLPVKGELVMLWRKEDRQKTAHLDIRVRYLDPEGNELQAMEFPLDLEHGNARHRHRLGIPSFPVTGSGAYIFEIDAKARGARAYHRVAEVPLDIDFRIEQ